MIVIDGSMGEGGGQILRTTLALAALLGETVKIVNIRAKRPRPGLQRQHLTSVRAVAEISSASVEGLSLGSTTIVFRPRELRGGRFRFDIGTAGSTTLVLQALLPVLVYAPEPVEVEITGGTDVPWSPPIDYVRFILRRLLARFGFNFDVVLKRRGHYPRGGGRVIVRVSNPPRRLEAADFSLQGRLERVEGLSHAVRLPRHVAERQARSAKAFLERVLRGDIPITIDVEWYEPNKDPHLGPGSGIVLWAITSHSILGGDSLGAKGKPAEKVGEEAAQKLYEDLSTGAALDRHASDMLIPFAALACGESVLYGSRLTLHAWTNMKVVEKLVEGVSMRFEDGGELGEPFRVRVKGICFSR